MYFHVYYRCFWEYHSLLLLLHKSEYKTMYLSNIFKFTEGLRQDGHQIGRKVGDALELLTFAMIEKDINLMKCLVVENGIEGATSAEHKVEFSFYQMDENGLPNKMPDSLFGLIECKKVGVEQTINNTFKKWRARNSTFYQTNGYNFVINSSIYKYCISLLPLENENNLKCVIEQTNVDTQESENFTFEYNLNSNDRILLAIDVNGYLHIKGPNEYLSSIVDNIQSCKVIRVNKIESNKIKDLIIEDALCGPQTPEKAKQASFVSLDVRKRVLGHFDKLTNDNDKFVSILVIGEASHWENKSRSMIRLCNDYNLLVPDSAIVLLLQKFEHFFGNGYQNMIAKSLYQNNIEVKRITNEVIDEYDNKILKDMDTGEWVKFDCQNIEGNFYLRVVNL